MGTHWKLPLGALPVLRMMNLIWFGAPPLAFFTQKLSVGKPSGRPFGLL